MRIRKAMTISLPPAMVRQVELVRKREHRTRSELVREALRSYLADRFPVVVPTKAELAAIRRGRAEMKAGNYVTLDQLIQGLKSSDRKVRRKISRKVAGPSSKARRTSTTY